MAGYSSASWAIWCARNGCITKDTPPPFNLPSTTSDYTPASGAGRAIGGVAYDLYHAPIGINSTGLAAALYNGITHDYSQIAGALASGAGRDAGGVAYDLWHAPVGITAGTLVGVLESVFSLNLVSAWAIANGL
jgi:hypothetical protein